MCRWGKRVLAAVCALLLMGAAAPMAELTLFADSPEDLGVVLRASPSSSLQPPYGELSEYLLEAEHFIFDRSLRPFLTENISPAVFNLFMARMDLGYKAMADLVGMHPCGGGKITILAAPPNHDYGYQWIYGGRPFIYWNTRWIVNILRNLQTQGADDWWFEGTMHELGHLFDDKAGDKWNFAAEGVASYKAFLTIEKLTGAESAAFQRVWNNNLAAYENPSAARSFFGNTQDDIFYLIHPIVRTLGMEDGWAVLKQVYRSYYDGSYEASYYFKGIKVYQARDFFERCSYFLGFDVKELWTEASIARYREQVEDVHPVGIFGTSARWYGEWWHYVLFFLSFGWIWMWLV